MNDKKTSYNTVPYPSFVFPQTSPDRLATLGRLRGIETSGPNDSDHLELGCGDGTNLIAFAYAYPRSRFLGIDLADRHIAHAKATAAKLDLGNVEFIAADICELDLAALGNFDTIVAHGLFSWIPDTVRERVLEMYRELLKPNGVGYISYNTFPGCRIRQLISDMMRFHTDEIEDPSERISEARNFVDFLSESLPENSVYGQIVLHEQNGIASRSDPNLFHDDLSAFNQPFYFHEFISMIGEYELSYIGEANPATANPARLRPEVREAIMGTSDDPLVREQYIDFLEMRRFRSSLVCHKDAEPLAKYDPGAFHFSRLVSTLSAEGETDLSPGVTMRFSGKHGALDIDHPLTKAFLSELARSGSSGAACDYLIGNAAKLLGAKPSTEELSTLDGYLLMMFRAEFITVHSCDAKFVTTVSEYPNVSAFARHQIESGSNFVTTLAEANLDTENLVIRAVMTLCDGSRNKEQIAANIAKLFAGPESERAEFEASLPEMIEKIIDEFAEKGLLIA